MKKCSYFLFATLFATASLTISGCSDKSKQSDASQERPIEETPEAKIRVITIDGERYDYDKTVKQQYKNGFSLGSRRDKISGTRDYPNDRNFKQFG